MNAVPSLTTMQFGITILESFWYIWLIAVFLISPLPELLLTRLEKYKREKKQNTSDWQTQVYSPAQASQPPQGQSVALILDVYPPKRFYTHNQDDNQMSMRHMR